MRHWTILAALLHAAADTITEQIAEQPNSSESAAAPTPDSPAPARRGRPPGSTNAPKPADSPTTPVTQPTETPEMPETALAKRKAIIKKYVDDRKGEEVKKIITNYSKTGLKDIPDDKLAEFAKDLETLDY